MLRLVLLFICSSLRPASCFFDEVGFHHIQCPNGFFLCDDDECISSAARCNRYNDCEDGSDEKNCDFEFIKNPLFSRTHFLSPCDKNEYTCKFHNECIPARKFCDSVKDCDDGSDEYNGCVHDLECSDRFRCNDKHCVVKEWVCDGVDDCPDGSDEWNCSANKTSSASDCKTKKSQYLCGNQRCIALNAVCNKKDDCGDGSDEGAGCTPSSCPSAGCSHECNQTPKGSVCTCKPGYELQNDNRTCKDIDECRTYGICDQECVNSPGSYRCTCQQDYFLEHDKKTCKAHAGEATLAFSTKTEIFGMYVDKRISFSLASNLNRASGVAMNGDYVYWSDIEKDREIIVRKRPLKDHEVIVTTGLSMVSDIAVDWITENIYFTDEGYNHIGVCNGNGTNCTVLIKINKPTGITLLPVRGKMYWSNGGINPCISVSGMDGKNIRKIVSTNLEWPKSVTIDYPNDRLYWVNSKSKIIESIRLDGTDRRLVLHDIIQEPFSLAIFENTLYWSDWGSNTIQSCNKFSGKDWRILYRTDNKPYGVHIDHSAIKPEIDNPCKSNPCSELCMLNEDKGYTCACTLDKELNADNHTCQDIKKNQHLLILAKEAFITYDRGLLGKPKVTNVSDIIHIDYIMPDPLSGQIIICKNLWLEQNIIRYDPISNTLETIAKIHIEILGGVAFDHIGNNLYMSNKQNKSIEVYNLRTLAMTAFYFQDFPSTIELVPEESKMFVIFQKFSFWTDGINLYEMRMDGVGKGIVIRENLKSSQISMCYDRNSKTLFVSNHISGHILSYSNKEMRVLRTGLNRPISLAVVGDNIFWTEFFSQDVYWTNFFKITSANHKAVAFRIPENLSIPAPLLITLRKDAKQDYGCQKNNGNCSHVCLTSSVTSFICACPPGMELSNDNHTCILHHECLKDEYKCSEHNLCIKKEQLCDGIVHCPNGEDETTDCEEKGKRCNEDQFMCKNGECINSKDRCNSHFDCTDQSDEENCDEPKCKSGEFQCRNGICIPNTKVCNSFPDCSDYSDELFINCQLHTCGPHQFMCNDRECIPNIFVCDGESDCVDSADEAPEKCKPNVTSVVSSCPDGHFRCTNDNCVSSSLKCDGTDDCGDGSDERHCLNKLNRLVNCTANEYHCLDTDICLPKKARCNGKFECPRLDDESHCSFCFEDEFACDNLKCIPENWVCDKSDDCGDNSDEKNCSGDKKIVSESSECDEFKCSVGTCLPYSKVCDGIRDCPDGSDENGKCQIACTMNNFCKGVCYKTPIGAVCGCQQGYSLATDAISCEDINECENDVCSQICWNTVGSYECSCQDGYIIRSDKASCKAVGSAMEFVTATKNDIRRISSNLHSIEMIHSSNPSVSGLDVDAVRGFVYWSNDEFGTIKRINIKTKEIITVTIVEHPQALAVDWITENVYVIDDSRPNTIKVCDLKKQRCATLVKLEDKAKAISLVVDPINKLLFWTQITPQEGLHQPDSIICRTDMMGFNMKIISFRKGFVTGMAIDHIKSKLYWSDIFQRTIESSNLDGSQNSTFLNTNLHHPLSISIYEQSLYWFMGSNGQIQICKLYGKKSCETLHLGRNNIHELFTILHTSRQPFDKNPCDEQYCDYMCVLKQDNAICICSNGKPIEPHNICPTNMNELKFTARSISSSRNTRNISSIYSVTIVVLLVGVLLLCVYYYYQKNKLKSKLATDLSCSSIRFQNPSYDRSDEVEVTLSVVSDLAPGQHEYVNPIDDKFLKTAMECSAQKSDQCSKENNVEETEKESNALLYFTHMK